MTTADVLEMFPKCSRCGWPIRASDEVAQDPDRTNRAAHAICLPPVRAA